MFGIRRGDPVPPPPAFPPGSATASLVSQLTSLLDASCPEWRSAAAEYAEQCTNIHVSDYDRRSVPYRKDDRRNIVGWVESNPEALLLLALKVNAGAENADRSAVVSALTSVAGLTQPHLRLVLQARPEWSETQLVRWESFAREDVGFGRGPGRGHASLLEPRAMSLSDQLRTNLRTIVSTVADHDLATGAAGPLAPSRVDLVSGVAEAVVLLSAERVLSKAAAGPLDDVTRDKLEASREVLSGRIAEAVEGLRAAVERHRELQGEFLRLRRAADTEHAESLRDPAAAEAVARVSAILEESPVPAPRVRIGPVPSREALEH